MTRFTADGASCGDVPGSGTDNVSGSIAEFDGEATVVSSSASGGFSYDFLQLGGNLAGGSMSLDAFSAIAIDASYFQNPNDYAGARSVAQSINFMDLAISGVDYLLSFDGTVRDDLFPTQNGGGSAFFLVADITSGFALLGNYGDTTPGDSAATPFSGAFTLAAGRSYRVGLGASTNALCGEFGAIVFCPTLDGSGDPLEVQAPGSYVQSAAVNFGFSLVPVPEPGTALLVGAGVALLARRRRA